MVSQQQKRSLSEFIESQSTTAISLVILVMCLLYWGLTCGLWDLWGSDEGRYVRIAQEWLDSDHNWFYLTDMGEVYDQKPPLTFWLFALGIKVFGGVSLSFATRFPSVIAASITVILVWLAGEKLYNRRVGIAAALITATSPLFLSHVPEARLDILFAAWSTLAAYTWITRPPEQSLSPGRAIVFWGALAGAFFIKGPLVFIFIICLIATEAVANRSWKFVKDSRLVYGIPFLALLIGGWFYMQGLNAGDEFVSNQVTEQTYERFLSGDHQEPFWYYFPRVFVGHLVPWSLLIIPTGILFWKERRQLTAGEKGLLGWVLIPFIFLCISTAKRSTYLLPLVPGAALLLAVGFDRLYLVPKRTFPRFNFLIASVSGLITGLFGIAGFMALFWFPHELRATFDLKLLSGIFALFLVPMLGSMSAMYFKKWRSLSVGYTFGAVALLMAVIGLAEFAIVNPAINANKSTRQFSVQVSDILGGEGANTPLGVIGKAGRAKYHVYSDYPVISIERFNDLGEKYEELPEFVMLRYDDYEDYLEMIESSLYQVTLDTVTDDDRIIILQKSGV